MPLSRSFHWCVILVYATFSCREIWGQKCQKTSRKRKIDITIQPLGVLRGFRKPLKKALLRRFQRCAVLVCATFGCREIWGQNCQKNISRTKNPCNCPTIGSFAGVLDIIKNPSLRRFQRCTISAYETFSWWEIWGPKCQKNISEPKNPYNCPTIGSFAVV